MQPQFHEATYRSGDAPEIVAASFCCQLCLERAGCVVVSIEAALALAICGRCEAETAVGLTEEQIVELLSTPPPQLPVSLVR